MLRGLVFWITIGTAAATAAHAAHTIRELEHAAEIAQCRGDAQEANEHRTQLLSKGRFVRQFDPRAGKSVYTFHKPN